MNGASELRLIEPGLKRLGRGTTPVPVLGHAEVALEGFHSLGPEDTIRRDTQVLL